MESEKNFFTLLLLFIIVYDIMFANILKGIDFNEKYRKVLWKYGKCFAKSDGKKNYEYALQWFELAAEQGNADAMFYIGEIYKNGKGVMKDIELEKSNLVVANFSIPFCNKEYFNEFWNKISDSILKERIFRRKLFWFKWFMGKDKRANGIFNEGASIRFI